MKFTSVLTDIKESLAGKHSEELFTSHSRERSLELVALNQTVVTSFATSGSVTNQASSLVRWQSLVASTMSRLNLTTQPRIWKYALTVAVTLDLLRTPGSGTPVG